MCKNVYVSGSIWCDDNADVYTGDSKHVRNLVLSQIYSTTETFQEIKVNCCDYFYFVCWSNDIGNNGLIAELNGSSSIFTGDSPWQVYATGSDRDYSNTRPLKEDVNSFIKKANCERGWQCPTLGQKNDDSNEPFPYVSNIDKRANFIWYDSGNDLRNRYPSTPYVPFVGISSGGPGTVNNPTHDEFLIFRIPVNVMHPEACKDCNCCEDSNCCSNCGDELTLQETEVSERAVKKSFTINAEGNNNKRCKGGYSDETCSELDIPKIEPCFYLHFGDSSSDKLEEHDSEVAYLTICNPYKNIVFKGLTITEVILSPPSPVTPNGELAMQIVPDRLIHFHCLKGCSCASREFAIFTRGIRAGKYNVEFKYCVEEVLVLNENTGSSNFEIDIVAS